MKMTMMRTLQQKSRMLRKLSTSDSVWHLFLSTDLSSKKEPDLRTHAVLDLKPTASLPPKLQRTRC